MNKLEARLAALEGRQISPPPKPAPAPTPQVNPILERLRRTLCEMVGEKYVAPTPEVLAERERRSAEFAQKIAPYTHQQFARFKIGRLMASREPPGDAPVRVLSDKEWAEDFLRHMSEADGAPGHDEMTLC